MTTQKQIDSFLDVRTIAIAGVSRSGKKMGNSIFKKLKSQNFEVFPLNPHINEINGEKCYQNFSTLPTIPDAYISVLSKNKTSLAVKEAAKAGIKKIWANLATVDAETKKLCDSKNVNLIQNECILMFANPKGGHKLHKIIWKLFGKLPK